MKDNPRKNNTRHALVFPTSAYFTIRDVVKLNQAMLTASKSDITIRVRLLKAIEDGKIAEIGSLPGGKGRPNKVFVMTPVTQLVINRVKADKINPVDNVDRLVHAVSVSNPSSQPTLPGVVVK